MAQQKLYTEFEVKFAMDIARCQPNLTFDEVLEQLTPIELSSDEEINIKAYNWCQVEHDEDGYIRAGDDYDISEMPAFIAGAKWLKDKILNQNKQT